MNAMMSSTSTEPRVRKAWVCEKRDGPWVVVRRANPDLSMGWVTYHFTRWGARRAVRRYLATGKTVGFRP